MSQKVEQQPLADFLAKHATPYEQTTDEYERPPFAADIKEGKNDPIYNAHSYHTKVPPRSIIPYILHYTQPGDLVLDPFCGSGMTGVAAQMCADPPADILESFPELKDRVGPRACILNDLSPAACHIAYNYNTPVDLEALKHEFERIKSAVKDEFDWLYGTEHYEPAVGLYDPTNPSVGSRLKNPPAGEVLTLLGGEARTWELLTKAEVETRLGYSVTELPRDDDWGDLDVAQINRWVCVPATIQYTIWSDVYRCEGFVTSNESTGRVSTRGKNAGKPIVATKRSQRGCGTDIVLWYAERDSSANSRFICPHCGQLWQKVQVQRVRSIPAITDLIHHTAEGRSRRRKRRTSQRERDQIAAIEAKRLPHWFPSGDIDPGREMMRHGLLKRGVRTLADFYTKRNLWALSALWEEAEKIQLARLRSGARFLLTSFLPRVSRKAEYRTGGGAGNTHNINIPAIHREDNVLKSLCAKEGDIISGLRTLASLGRRDASCVSKQDARYLASVPDCSVDFVFTDPPFGSNIFYADCSILWESWLDEFTSEASEIVVNERRQGGSFKTLDDYGALITQAFKEMNRVLKPGRWATVVFNNSDGSVFEAIKKAAVESGFEIASMLLLDRVQKTFKQVQGALGNEDVVDKDVLFNLHKPAFFRAEVRAEDHDLEQQVADAVRQHLQTLPDRIKAEPSKYNDEHRTTATINSMLMNVLIPIGVSVERLNLPFIERVCARYFRKIGQRWYLRGEAVGADGGDGLFAAAVAVTDELTAIEWLRGELRTKPKLLGELKPLWMRATGLLSPEVSQSLVLEDLLSENFWRDAATNRWREPTPEERERMNDDRSLRVLHDTERFVNNALRRDTSDEERCEWIDVLFQACRAIEGNEMDSLPALRGFDKAEAYRLIPRLFQSVMRDHVAPGAYARAEKQARAASRRIVRETEDARLSKAPVGQGTDQSKLDFEG